MKGILRHSVVAAVLGILATFSFATPVLAGGKQSFTGEVSDAMCGRKHMEESAADCTRACVQHGSKYSLVVGEKVYTLETSDKALLAMLDQQAGKKVIVQGALNGDTVEVSSVTAAK